MIKETNQPILYSIIAFLISLFIFSCVGDFLINCFNWIYIYIFILLIPFTFLLKSFIEYVKLKDQDKQSKLRLLYIFLIILISSISIACANLSYDEIKELKLPLLPYKNETMYLIDKIALHTYGAVGMTAGIIFLLDLFKEKSTNS